MLRMLNWRAPPRTNFPVSPPGSSPGTHWRMPPLHPNSADKPQFPRQQGRQSASIPQRDGPGHLYRAPPAPIRLFPPRFRGKREKFRAAAGDRRAARAGKDSFHGTLVLPFVEPGAVDRPRPDYEPSLRYLAELDCLQFGAGPRSDSATRAHTSPASPRPPRRPTRIDPARDSLHSSGRARARISRRDRGAQGGATRGVRPRRGRERSDPRPVPSRSDPWHFSGTATNRQGAFDG
jgi:hypothetical protein